MAIKRKGIFAVPGEYKYGDNITIKTADELKLAAELQPIISLVYRHPADGIPSQKDVIGTVSQEWDETTQKVFGDFWFYDDKIPDSIKELLEQNKPIPISAGFTVDDLEDNVMKGIYYTHMAVLDGEDPVCPLGQCGINIRMEAKPNRTVYFEQETNLEAQEEKAPPAVDAIIKGLLDEVYPDVEPIVETPIKTDEPAVQKPETAVVKVPVEEVKLEPEVRIPVGDTVPKEWDVDANGWIHFVPQRFKKEK